MSRNNNLLDFPEIIAEWHPVKNSKIAPKDLLAKSGKKCWWICSKGHEWKVACYKRTQGSSCPYCANKKVCKDNCLASLYPKIAKEWHPIKNGEVSPNNIVAGTGKIYWWICNKQHEWRARAVERTKGRGCPYCKNRKACIENCLSTLHPDIAKEWHPVKNGNITPKDILPRSGKKHWWKCQNGHEWQANSDSRIGNNRGCPICKESKGEKKIAEYLIKNRHLFERQARFSTCKDKRTLPFDFLVKIPNLDFLIEYHGDQHYRPIGFGTNKIKAIEIFSQIAKRDFIKHQWCKNNKIHLLVIPHQNYNDIDSILDKYIGNLNKASENNG